MNETSTIRDRAELAPLWVIGLAGAALGAVVFFAITFLWQRPGDDTAWLAVVMAGVLGTVAMVTTGSRRRLEGGRRRSHAIGRAIRTRTLPADAGADWLAPLARRADLLDRGARITPVGAAVLVLLAAISLVLSSDPRAVVPVAALMVWNAVVSVRAARRDVPVIRALMQQAAAREVASIR